MDVCISCDNCGEDEKELTALEVNGTQLMLCPVCHDGMSEAKE